MRVLKEGTQLAGRYTLIRRLGAGGMAEVWLASDRLADTRIALKFLATEWLADPAYRDLLHKEWRLNSRLMHANIVRVFEFHDDPDGAFYSLQYTGDVNIGVLCGKNPADALRPVGLIADALRYAHNKGVVHRDIKAANVLLDSRGVPYLVDFGVAAAAGSASPAGGGSAIASSPQQLAGQAATVADDIFGLGVLMVELLTGAPPPANIGDTNLLLPDGSKMPTALQALVTDMLAADPARRPQAEVVKSRLEEAGYAAGPAPAHYLGGSPATDLPVEAVESIQPVRRKTSPLADPATLQTKDSGISPKLLYGSLGGVLAILLAVIFLLPNAVQKETLGVDRVNDINETSADASRPEDPDTVDADIPGSGQPNADTSFNENAEAGDLASIKAATDEALGDLLSRLERLRYRAIDRWGGQPYLDAVDVYETGDEAYVNKNYQLAGDRYREASALLEPFFDRIDAVFAETLAAAGEAFAASDHSEAIRLYDLAVAITPGNREAEAGLARAQNLEAVLTLTAQGIQFESDLELDAAKLAFEKALQLDAVWEPALAGLERVRIAANEMSFGQRMTEGLDALAAGDFASARAAFNAAKLLDPKSRQPTDGLLQVDQEIKLAEIRNLENEAAALDAAEQWELSANVYKQILDIDADLQFAQDGLRQAMARSALHARLAGYIDDPDQLSDQVNVQNATKLLLEVTRMTPMGPRLEDQKNLLSRLLKRAATPLPVQLISDNATNVAIFKIGQLGTFSAQEISLRPGKYVAVGNRAGYRDVRIEFRVAPEDDMQPIVIQCEEQI
jgi:serine/threonine protein kinase